MNYFLGIDSTTRVLAADFEDTASGGNHPVLGTTAICDGVWYHAAATYDGTTWRLYLNGELETAARGRQLHAARPTASSTRGSATAMTSTGVGRAASSRARSTKCASGTSRAAPPTSRRAMGGPLRRRAPSLIGRWALDEGDRHDDRRQQSGRGNTGTLTNGPTLGGRHAVRARRRSPPGNYGLRLTGHAAAGDYVDVRRGARPRRLARSPSRPGSGATAPASRPAPAPAASTRFRSSTKGRAEAEGGNVDMNYFLGIRATDDVLVADFEEARRAQPGLNHPDRRRDATIAGSPTPPWHHAAVTYDGTTCACI